MKHYTTLEQSKKLVKLGLNPDTADMFYSRRPTGKSEYSEFPDFKLEGRLEVFTKVDLPCWSLGALLNVLKTRKDCNFITIHSSYSLKWILNTSYYELANWKEKETIGETPIEAVYNMVCWLLENGYVKKRE